ncbi:MAG: hypothetical protein CMP91_06785 [Gammaproteobacteria bacterium]|nr:hypothetical protein [Gammaproteobacteria bacterium]
MYKQFLSFGCIVFISSFITSVRAQPVNIEVPAAKSREIVHTMTAPVLDGNLDDAVWENALFIDDLHQVNPVEYAQPSERTELYLLYDENALYVGARMYIDPDVLTARVLRRNGNVIGDDNIIVNINPFNNQRTGYYFGVNPNGVPVDGIFQNVTQPYNDWDSIFYVEVGEFEGGWTAEFEIPYKSLTVAENITTWGLNFTRSIQGRNETLAWQSYDRRYDPSNYGELQGMVGVDQGVGLDITPSVSISDEQRYNPDSSESSFEPSLDVVYKLTPSLNGSLTFNTDFSATEVDNRQVNLTRFSLFFPEKRDFFLRESDIFEFGRIGSSGVLGGGQNGRPFFSRNIGLGNNGQQVDLEYGGKVSGRVGNLDIGALSIRQDSQGAVEASTLSVVRGNYGLPGQSTLGFILTDGNPRANVDNSLYGLDYLYRNAGFPGPGKTLEVSGWAQRADTQGLEDDEDAAGLGVAINANTGLGGGVAWKRFESNFRPALGFANRVGVDDYNAQLGYTYRPTGGRIQSADTELSVRRYEYIDAGLQSQTIRYRTFDLNFRSRDRLFWISNFNKEVLLTPFEVSDGIFIQPGEYTFNDHGGTFQSSTIREWATKLTYVKGGFYNGDREWFEADLTWQPTPRFRASVQYDLTFIDLPQGSFATRLVSGGLDFVFSPRLSWINLIQYDNVSETMGLNMRLHWVPEEGQEVYFVINQMLEDYDRDNSFNSAFTDVTAKFSYTFRY